MHLLEAARRAGLCKRTIRRAREWGVLPCVKGRRTGAWFVRWATARQAPLVTVGAAAKRLKIHVTTLRRWIHAGLVQTGRWQDVVQGYTPALRLSLAEIDRLAQERAGRRRRMPKVRRGAGGETIHFKPEGGPGFSVRYENIRPVRRRRS